MSGPITYEIDGDQYVTITTGWGSAYALGTRYPFDETVPTSLGKVVTFKLDSTGRIAPPRMTRVDQVPKVASFGSEQQIADGMVHYQRNCAVCHGGVAISSGVLPDLRWSRVSANAEAWRCVVLEGSLASPGMVSFADYLSAEDAESVRAYVLAQAAASVDGQR